MTSICLIVQNVYDFDPRVRRKAEALAAAGYRVDVLALRGTRQTPAYSLNGVNVATLSLGKKRGSLARYLLEYVVFFLWAAYRATLQMATRRYSVIDVNSLPDFLIFAAALPRWMGARLLLDLHEVMPEFYMSKYGIAESSAPVRLLKWLERISFRFADRVITVNDPIQDLLERRGLPRSKATVVMNSVDEARFAPEPPSAPEANRFVMMYHGTLTRIYGLDIAVQAFAAAHEQMRGAELWILGSGPEETALASLAEECGVSSKVKFIGQVPSHEIPAWLSRCHAGILPIRRDCFLDLAFPNKLPEFVVAGKPVLMSRLNAVRKYFDEDAAAFFEPHDVLDLARKMIHLYDNPGARSHLAHRAREQYTAIRWDVMKRRYLDVVEELAVQASARRTQHPTPDGTIVSAR